MALDPSVQAQYLVNTPPMVAPRTQGQIMSLMNIDQMRFMAFEPFSGVNGIPCGVVVTATTNAMGKTVLTQPIVAGQPMLGVTIWNQQRLLDYDTTLGQFSYKSDEMVSLLEEGDVVMFSEVAVDVGQPVYSRLVADAALTRLGALSNAAGAGLELIPRAKFLEKSLAGLVRVHVDF